MTVKNGQFVIRVYGIIINNQNEILVSDEFHLDMKMTKFPGGGLEFGEGPEDCLQREFKEECNGQELENIRHFYTTGFFQKALFYENHQLISIYYQADLKSPLQLEISDRPFSFDKMENGNQSFRWIKIKDLKEDDFTFPIDKFVSLKLKKMNPIQQNISENHEINALILSDQNFQNTIEKIIQETVKCFRSGNRAFFCGNGGSASEAQHLAAELSGKFKIDRKPLPAEACHINPSFITAVSNDYSFERSYERYIEAFGSKGDILFGLSTSGNSKNIIKAFIKAREIGIVTIAMTGNSGGKLKDLADFHLIVPSENVSRIQEIHLLVGHIICEMVEMELFADDSSK